MMSQKLTFEIIGFVSIFGKTTMKNAYLPKISILLQFWGEILALLCPDDSIQTLLILSRFQTLRTETKLEGFVWNHRGITEPMSCPQITIRC